jgi:hypothetical protein
MPSTPSKPPRKSACQAPLGARLSFVIPGCATWRRPGIHNHDIRVGRCVASHVQDRQRWLWIPGSRQERSAPRNDGGGRSRGAKAPELLSCRVPRKSEGAGKAGCVMHPQPRVQNDKKHTSQSPQVHRNIPAFPAQWFTAYSELSSVTGLSCHRRGADCSAPLDASVGAPGPHGFAVRVGIVRRSTPQRPSHPAPTFVTIMIRPSGRARDGRPIELIWVKREAIYFCNPGWTGFC